MNRMPPVDMLCYYKVDSKDEAAFTRLLEQHWPTLLKLGLATDKPATVFRSKDKAGNIVFVEYYQWVDADAPRVAHQTPDLMQVWEPMGALTQGKMEFWQMTPVPMPFAK
jgi:quinol monooxygenase YgiN